MNQREYTIVQNRAHLRDAERALNAVESVEGNLGNAVLIDARHAVQKLLELSYSEILIDD